MRETEHAQQRGEPGGHIEGKLGDYMVLRRAWVRDRDARPQQRYTGKASVRIGLAYR
jgi:hypothetical protein